MSTVVLILRTVRDLFADPRRWVQGHWAAHRDHRGVIVPLKGFAPTLSPNCWCLSGAINAALAKQNVESGYAELRSGIEDELLDTLRGEGVNVNAVYVWNDDKATAFADVVRVLDKTLLRLEAA